MPLPRPALASSSLSFSCSRVARPVVRDDVRPTCDRTFAISVPRAPLEVEQHAPMALRTEQPFALSRVSQPEAAPTDRALVHPDLAPRTVGVPVLRVRLAHRALLRGLELCALSHWWPRRSAAHASLIRTTTFPNCSPLASRAKASRAFASGWTESTTGASRPAASSATTASNSASFPIVEPRIDHWCQKSFRTSMLSAGPDVPPQVTSRPPRVSAPSDCAHVASPIEST